MGSCCLQIDAPPHRSMVCRTLLSVPCLTCRCAHLHAMPQQQGVRKRSQRRGPCDGPAAKDRLEAAKREAMHHRRCGLSVSWLPYILCASDCIAGLGSGMTIKYFPIWLIDRVHLQPSAVNLVQSAVPVLLAAAAMLVQQLAAVAGKPHPCCACCPAPAGQHAQGLSRSSDLTSGCRFAVSRSSPDMLMAPGGRSQLDTLHRFWSGCPSALPGRLSPCCVLAHPAPAWRACCPTHVRCPPRRAGAGHAPRAPGRGWPAGRHGALAVDLVGASNRAAALCCPLRSGQCHLCPVQVHPERLCAKGLTQHHSASLLSMAGTVMAALHVTS